MAGCGPGLFAAVVDQFASKHKKFQVVQERESHQSCTLKISARCALQVLYFTGNMAATKQIIGETLLKRKTTMTQNAPLECGAPALFPSTVGSYRAQFSVH